MSEELLVAGGLAVEAAGAAGADEAEAWVERSREVEVRVYEGAVESLSDAGSHGIGIRVFDGGRPGYAYGTDLSASSLRELAQAAVAAARVVDPDEHGGLPAETGAASVEGLADPGVEAWTTERKVALAVEVERVARSHEGVSQVEDTVYSDTAGTVAIVNSIGLSATYEATAAWAYASAFAGVGNELMTGLGVGLGRGPDALDPRAIGAEAAERALALRGARQPGGGRWPVVLDAFVAASFVGFIGAMLSAESVQRGRSLFADREGEGVASERLRLVDDGVHADGPASAPFDGEGVARGTTTLISEGRLESFLYDSRSGRVAGRSSTGNAARSSYRAAPSVGASNLVVDEGSGSAADLVAAAGEGLFVTDVVGLHSGVNPVSGTFSVGAAGRMIRGGELAEPVREVTIASDLLTMLRGVEAVGSASRWVPFGGSVRAAPLLIGEMTVSGA